MSTIAQTTANRENALLSTGPKSAEGKTRSARNAVTLGLFTMHDFVLPDESAEHQNFCFRFWADLNPATPVEETFATEMIRAAWRLRRCGIIEAGLAEAPAETPEQNEANLRTQTAVDRARAQANNIFRRCFNDLRRLQAAQSRPAEPAAPDTDGFGFSNPPAPEADGFEFSTPPDLKALAESAVTIRTQLIPRSAPCPCGSGDKYKRCCGRNAPPALHQAA